MAVRLQIEYGDVQLAEIEIPLTSTGEYVKAIISAVTPSLQVAHVWKPSQPTEVATGTSAVNSEVDKSLKIILRADSATDLGEDDFVQLRTAIALWLFIEGADTGLTIAQAEFEVVETGLIVAQAELEIPAITALFVAQAQLEVVQTGLIVAMTQLEVPSAGALISETVAHDALLGEGGEVLEEE